MKKIWFILIGLMCVGALLQAAGYPDFSKIVARQHQVRAADAAFYNELQLTTRDTRDMDNYDVTWCGIDITIDVDNHSITADNAMNLTILEDGTSEIELNFTNDLTIDGIQHNGTALSYTHVDELITITLDGSYNSGDALTLSIQYSGFPQNRLNDGMKFQEHNGVPVVFTMVSPRGARKWWPCKDTPADKPQSLDMQITYPDTYTSAANGLLVETIMNPDNTKTDVWHTSYPVATYLTSLALTNYQIYSFDVQINGQTMPVDNYCYPERWDDSVALFGTCGDMLTHFSTLYGIYPFLNEKYGHATTTNLGAYAMEHNTCTSFDAGYINDDAAEYTVAHELTHQWYGDAVSISTWSDVWLKEGFASYGEALWAEHQFGPQGRADYMEAEDTGSVLDDCLYREPDASANTIFNGVVYQKGSWTVNMLRGVLGDDDFFALLQAFATSPAFAYGNTTTAQLCDLTESICGYDMEWFFDQWYYNLGRPIYRYATYQSAATDSLVIAIHSAGTSGDPFAMYVPYRLNGVDARLWVPDGMNHCAIYLDAALDELVFDPDSWVLDQGYMQQIPELDEVTASRDGSLVITWQPWFDDAIDGFKLYRAPAGGSFSCITPQPITCTSYFDEDVTAGQEYQYKLTAVYNGQYESQDSNIITAQPFNFSFDQGILLVDGTKDYPAGMPFPSDDEVDSFYHAALGDYPFADWDIEAQGMVPLSEMAKYSTIIWHADDIVNPPFGDELYHIKSYLMAGGNLLFSAWKMLHDSPAAFQAEYLHFSDPLVCAEADFAAPLAETGYPALAVNTDKIPLSLWGDNLNYVNTIQPVDGGQTVYRFSSASGNPDWQDEPVAVKYYGDFNTMVLGFPLYFMQDAGAAAFLDVVLQEFGESSPAGQTVPPATVAALHNYPNPFSPSGAGRSNATEIYFTLSSQLNNQNQHVTIEIFNIRGQKVRKLEMRNEKLEMKGEIYCSATWDGTDSNGKAVPSGLYFAQLKADGTALAQHKMMLIK